MVRFFDIFFVKVVMSMCLLCLIFVWILLIRLLICFLIGWILMRGLRSFVGLMICLIIFGVCLILYGFGVVEMYMILCMCFLNFLNWSGWLLSVDGRWNLWLISICFFVWLLLNMLCICGIVMCDLLMIIIKLFGK